MDGVDGPITIVRARVVRYKLESALAVPYSLLALEEIDPLMDGANCRHIEMVGRNENVAYILTDSEGGRIESQVYSTKDIGEDVGRIYTGMPGAVVTKPVDETFVVMNLFCYLNEAVGVLEHLPELAGVEDLIGKIPTESLGRKNVARTLYRNILMTAMDDRPPFQVHDYAFGTGPILLRYYSLDGLGRIELVDAGIVPKTRDERIARRKYTLRILPFDCGKLTF